MSKEKFDMSINELETFFNKYDVIELEAFNSIFGYIYDYEMDDVLKAARKAYNEKWKTDFDDFDVFVVTNSSKISDILNKNNLLNDKEIKFLYNLTDNALMCLDSIQHIDVEYEKINLFTIVNSIEQNFKEIIEETNESHKTKKLV